MKKIFAIGFLLVLLLPAIATYYVYQYREAKWEQEVKEHIAQGIDLSQLRVFTFSEEDSKTELNWEHSKEFEYKGEMYDIVRSETKGDSITYFCFWDKTEKGLKKQYRHLFSTALFTVPVQSTPSIYTANLEIDKFVSIVTIKANYALPNQRLYGNQNVSFKGLPGMPPNVPPPQHLL